jgi:hypothetical protein
VLDDPSVDKAVAAVDQEPSADTRDAYTPNRPALERLLNIDEAARIIGRTHWTLRRDIRRGVLKCIRIGRRIMVEPAEIRRLIEEGREPRIRAE